MQSLGWRGDYVTDSGGLSGILLVGVCRPRESLDALNRPPTMKSTIPPSAILLRTACIEYMVQD